MDDRRLGAQPFDCQITGRTSNMPKIRTGCRENRYYSPYKKVADDAVFDSSDKRWSHFIRESGSGRQLLCYWGRRGSRCIESNGCNRFLVQHDQRGKSTSHVTDDVLRMGFYCRDAAYLLYLSPRPCLSSSSLSGLPIMINSRRCSSFPFLPER